MNIFDFGVMMAFAALFLQQKYFNSLLTKDIQRINGEILEIILEINIIKHTPKIMDINTDKDD